MTDSDGEACDNGANEPTGQTEHIIILPNDTYENLPATDERSEH